MTEPEDDFAAMFEASAKARRIEKGQAIEGQVVAIGAEVAFVDVGGKGEATIDLAEMKNDEGELEVAVGDRIRAVVVSTAGGIVLSRALARSAASNAQLEDAYRSGLPVEGRVEREVKGGFEIRVGRARGFTPHSQIDTLRTEPSAHLGRVYRFRIIEYKEGGRSIVLSRRALLEEEQKAAAADVRKSIVPGAVLTGRVATVREFGAFIELGGGVQGLLHISEMGWSRVSDPSRVVTPGDEITVKVLAVDEAAQKISLGLKQLTPDPWTAVAGAYEAGQIHTGRVTRLTDFGAFVELAPGIEALAHASTFPPGQPDAWRRLVRVGTTAAFEILSVDPEKKRISVAPAPEGAGVEEREHDAARGGDAPGEAFGSLADKLRGALNRRER